MKRSGWRQIIRHLTVSGACALTIGVAAQAQAQTKNFDIAEGDLKIALDRYLAQSGVQLIYKVDDIYGLSTKGVKGSLVPDAALSKLLEGTRLRMQHGTDGAVVIVLAPADSALLESSDEQGQAVAEVYITATRRREPAREVPMQVNILNADALERGGAMTLADYVENQPGVNLMSGGIVGGELSMRGVTTGDPTQSTVGVYVDDVATGSSSAYAAGSATSLDMGMLDLSHIEILRGPQGTLYGAGAMGGLLKYVTNMPDTEEFSGKVRVGAASIEGGGTNATANVVLNIPIKAGVAALRVAAFKDHFGGYYKTVGPAAGSNIDRGATTGERLALLLTPTKELTIRMTATAQDVRRNGVGVADLNPLTGQPIDGDLTRRLYVPEGFANRMALYGLDVEYDFGWARLNAITSAQKVSIYTKSDLSPDYVPGLLAAGLPAQSVTLEANVKQHRVSQEFRLTSRLGTAVEWLAGAYLNRENATQEGGVRTELGMGLGNMELLTRSLPSSYSEVAAYGDLTWQAAPKLSLTGGLRVARNRQTYISNTEGMLAGGASISGGHSEETTFTYLATAKYAIAPSSNVYVRAASGYRPGGPNGLLPTTSTAIVPTSFKSDSLWSYELGYKAALLERTLLVEASVYDIEWAKLQQHVISSGFGFITNGGNARVRGSELALKWRPAPDWNLSLAATTIDAHLTSDAQGLGANAGARLPQSARFSLALGVMRNFTVAGHDAYLGANAHHVGERNAGFDNSPSVPNFRMPAYTLLDVQTGMDFRHFNVQGYIRNLSNRRGILSAGISADRVQAVVTQPRTVGMAITVPF